MPHASEDLGDKQLHPRDRLFRDTFTPAEHLSFWTLLITAAVTFAYPDPRSFWILGFLLIVGGFCPVIVKTHEHTHPFFTDKLWKNYWLLSAPVWLICLQYVLGLLQHPIVPIEFDGQSFDTIRTGNVWLPATSVSSTTWITLLGYASAYIVALNLFIIPKSRSFFERILPWFCVLAVLVGISGYLQKSMGLENPLFTHGTGQSDFFGFFPYEGHWAAFAMLWSAVCVALALFGTRIKDQQDFVNTTGPWYLTGATILGASGFIIEARWPATLLLLSFSVLLLLTSVHFLANTSDRHHTRIALSCGLISTAAFATGIYRMFQPSHFSEQANALRHTAFEMFADRPIFGWGLDSFAEVAPFYQSDYLHGARYERACSDLIQLPAELGLFGSLLVPAVCLFLVIRHYRRRKEVILTNHLLIGCISVLAYACVDTPFMSPAVFLSFFIVLFSALRWADLSRREVDTVDANDQPKLVIPESHRRVPAFTGVHNEKEK